MFVRPLDEAIAAVEMLQPAGRKKCDVRVGFGVQADAIHQRIHDFGTNALSLVFRQNDQILNIEKQGTISQDATHPYSLTVFHSTDRARRIGQPFSNGYLIGNRPSGRPPTGNAFVNGWLGVFDFEHHSSYSPNVQKPHDRILHNSTSVGKYQSVDLWFAGHWGILWGGQCIMAASARSIFGKARSR